MPTYVPTAIPTLAPSEQTTPIVSFSSNITVGGATEPTLDEEAQEAVVNATAASMGTDISTVFYDGETAIPENRRALLSSISLLATTSWTIIARTRVEVPLATTSFENATELYNTFTNNLDTAVSTGAFTEKLVEAASSLNATSLLTANATSVTNSAVEVEDVVPVNEGGGGGSSDELSGGAIAGIVIAVFIVVALAAAGIYYALFLREDTNREAFKANSDVEISL